MDGKAYNQICQALLVSLLFIKHKKWNSWKSGCGNFIIGPNKAWKQWGNLWFFRRRVMVSFSCHVFTFNGIGELKTENALSDTGRRLLNDWLHGCLSLWLETAAYFPPNQKRWALFNALQSGKRLVHFYQPFSPRATILLPLKYSTPL